MANQHLTLSAPALTGIISFVVFILTWVAANASSIVKPKYAPVVAALAGAVAGFLTHNYYTPAPTSNAGAPSTVAGPPGP